MNLKGWLKQWGLDSLKINAQIVEAEWSPQPGDREAAWKVYIELLTRITTQALPSESGDEEQKIAAIRCLL